MFPMLKPLKLVLLFLVIVAFVSSCIAHDAPGGSGEGPTIVDPPITTPPITTPPTVPGETEDFYMPPAPMPPGPAGTLLRTADAPALAASMGAGSATKVLYSSVGIDESVIAVSGVVAVPAGNPPQDGWPVVAWAHGTTGVADACAPSRDETLFGYSGYLAEMLSRGYAVVATDYEGLGTPGDHPYINKVSEARGVIDSVRAAHQLEAGTAALLSPEWVVIGHSQGGQAALATAELDPSYGDPALPLKGVAGLAPASMLPMLPAALVGSGFEGYLAFAAAGIVASTPGITMADLFGPAGLERATALETGCWNEVMEAFSTLPAAEFFHRTPAGHAAVETYLAANEPGTMPMGVPTLLLQGSDDTTIPAVATEMLRGRLCGAGESVDHREYAGVDHGGILWASGADLSTWIADRFAGVEPVGCR